MQRTRFPSLVLLSLLLIVCAEISSGQSGRQTPSTTTPPKEPSKTEPQNDSAPWQRIKVLVGRQPTSRKLLSEDTIYAAFVQRLNEQKNVEAFTIGDLKKQSEAIKRAQAETDQFVVLLKLEI